MNFYDYIGISPENFEAYITNGRVMRNSHDWFPLDIYNYTRATVQENDVG